MIVVDRLCKAYEKKSVLDNISFHIRKGECVGLVGLNGVGKTTLINILLGRLMPNSGLVRLFGKPSDRLTNDIKRRVGLISGTNVNVPDDTKIKYLFDRQAAMYGVAQDDYTRHKSELIDLLDIGDFLDSELRRLSLGQRMKVELALTLIQRPQLLILDEATIGLDAISRQLVDECLKKLSQDGTTIIFSGHKMSEIEQLCQRLIMLHDRHILYDGETKGFMQQYGGIRRISLNCPHMPDLEDLPIESMNYYKGRFQINFDRSKVTAAEIIRHLSTKCTPDAIESIFIEEPSLEDSIRAIYSRRSDIK